MYNVVLAAGDGARFKGYDLPKPLLKVKKKSIIIRAANSLPKNNNYIFLCKKKHFDKYREFNFEIKKNFKNSKIILLKKTTNGQASSLYKIKKIVKKNSPIFVTSTDFCFLYDKKKLNEYLKKNINIIFVCKPNKEMKKFKNNFGWVRTDKKKNVIKISCKKKINGNSKNDKIILGAFAFSSFEVFTNGYKKMLKHKRLVNNEYYIDILMDEIKKYEDVKIIEVKKFINWGTPFEFEKNKNNILK